jgi:integrase
MLSPMSDKNLRILAKVEISTNRRMAEAYYNKALARGLSPLGVRKTLYCLARLSGLLGKPFSKSSLNDLERAMARIETSFYAENTKNLFRATVKAFYGKQDPRVSWIRVRGRTLTPKLPEDLISREELAWLISATRDRRKKALLAFLYDSAMRPREFAALRREHVVPDGQGMFVMIPRAKTPARTIYLTESRKWLGDIPFGMNPSTMSNFFKRTGKRMGKRLYPYLLRHSRITELSKVWSDEMLKKFAGWTPSSPMLEVYVHLSHNDLRYAMLSIMAPGSPGGGPRLQGAAATAGTGGISFGA